MMDLFTLLIDGFETNSIFNKLQVQYIHMKHSDKLSFAGYVGVELWHRKTDNRDGGLFYVLFFFSTQN